ncbi:MAG: selenocysteine-specific translation elongation factor [Thermodesulfobacteriota bacterium]|nr:selenocysteine-specific translation elongation factor [Thermodesulfobacteriota bacterium]
MEKHITIGVAGHVDHGKNALVNCLTGIDTDRLQEEKRRGFSIESGIAPLNLPSGTQVALVDVPGQTSFLKNSIRGLSCVDMAILVVAADDGIMPGTLEHLNILNFLKVKSGFIVLSKADLVDDEMLELGKLEIMDQIKGTFLEGKPVISYSATDRRGLNEIRLNIEKQVENIAGKNQHASFRLWIDQIRTFTGFGTVVSGTILSGTIRQDDMLHLLPSGKETRARFLEVHQQRVSRSVAGQRVGINLHKVPLKDVKRGMMLAKPETVNGTYILNVDIHVLQSVKELIKNRQRVKLYLGTSVTNAMAVIMEKEQLEAGESGLVQFRLIKPVPALPGDPFVICPLNVHTVIGGGIVLEIPLEKYRAAKAEITIPYLEALRNGDLKLVMDHFFDRNISHPVTAADIARETGFQIKEVEAEVKLRVKSGEILYFEGRGLFGKNPYKALKKKSLKIVENVLLENPFQATIMPDEIKTRLLPSIDEAPFQRMLAELCQEGKLIKTDGGFQVRNLLVKLSKQQERLITLLLEYARHLGIVPFRADMFWKLHKKKFNKNEIQRLLDYLHNQKRLIRLNNGRFLTPRAMEQIKDGVRNVIVQKGRLTLADSKETLGYGRTVGVPVLEYLDAIGFTCRQENERVLKKEGVVKRYLSDSP